MDAAELGLLFAGVPDAWNRLAEAYAGRARAAVAALLRTRTGGAQESDVDDIVGEIFLRLIRDDFRLLRSWDPDRASFGHWLAVVSRSTALNALARRRPKASDPAVLDRPAPAPPASLELPPDLLTPRQALVLQLHFDRGLASDEIARLLRIDAQTVRNLKSKALARLREHYGGAAATGSGDAVP